MQRLFIMDLRMQGNCPHCAVNFDDDSGEMVESYRDFRGYNPFPETETREHYNCIYR